MTAKIVLGFTAAAVATVMIVSSCGSDKKDDPAPAAPETPATFADIKPLIIANCATSNCHVTGKTSPDYSAITEAKWTKTDLAPVGVSMPKPVSAISAADLAKIKSFVPTGK